MITLVVVPYNYLILFYIPYSNDSGINILDSGGGGGDNT